MKLIIPGAPRHDPAGSSVQPREYTSKLSTQEMEKETIYPLSPVPISHEFLPIITAEQVYTDT